MKLKFFIILVVAAVLVCGIVALIKDDKDKPIPIKELPIKELLENKEKYNEKNVTIKGKIINQCPRGCKFNVDDGTGIIFVQTVKEAWEKPPPPSIGRTVKVKGIFYQNPRPHIIVEKPEYIELL